jgi:hypothetical protein
MTIEAIDAQIREMLYAGQKEGDISQALGVSRTRVRSAMDAVRREPAARNAEIIRRFDAGIDRTCIASEMKLRGADVSRVLVAHDAHAFALRDMAKGRTRHEMINRVGIPADVVRKAWAEAHPPMRRIALTATGRMLTTATDDSPQALAKARRVMAQLVGVGGWSERVLA